MLIDKVIKHKDNYYKILTYLDPETIIGITKDYISKELSHMTISMAVLPTDDVGELTKGLKKETLSIRSIFIDKDATVLTLNNDSLVIELTLTDKCDIVLTDI